MDPMKLVIQSPFSTALSINPLILEALQEDMRNKGFDPAHPVVIWKETNIVIDGHTRREAAILCGIGDVPVVEHSFPGELEALGYLKHHQEFRRQNDDGVILRMVELMDERKSHQEAGALKGKKVASRDASFPGKSAAETAAKIGTSQAKVERARQVMQDPEIKEAVIRGEKTINAASKEVVEKKKATPSPAKISVFNQTNDNIEWARWSWNPVTGCKHECDYCYARDIGIRFNGDFSPTFHPERLAAPQNTKIPQTTDIGLRNVFVCSMADLFGDWVPDGWIDKVLEAVRNAPGWNFLFLTKNPDRMVDIEWPDNAWVGTTVDRQSRVASAESAFKKIKATVKFLSCEPLLEPVSFSDMTVFDWVIIGGRSKNSQGPEFQPEWSWVEGLLVQARGSGCKVYFKPNLKSRPVEYPDIGG